MRDTINQIFSLVLIVVLGLGIIWCIANYSKLEEGFSGSNLYTQEDLNNAYNDGYNTAFTDREEYESLINSYRDKITTQSDEIDKLKDEIQLLKNDNNNKADKIAELEADCSDLKNKITLLETSGLEDEQTIALLQHELEEKNAEITRLNNLLLNNATEVSELNDRIKALENSIAYYEEYIQNLETNSTAVVTFEFNNEVYAIKEVAKGDYVSIEDPTSSTYLKFNYWTINGVQVDLSTTPINENTTIVANVTRFYDVKFIVDDEEYHSSIIAENGTITAPETPVLDNYEFEYWILGNTQINSFDNIFVNRDMVFTAKLTRLYLVQFSYYMHNENNELTIHSSEQKVKENGIATAPIISNTNRLIFSGWRLIDTTETIDVNSYIITSDTTFMMVYTEKFLYSFMIEDNLYYSCYAESHTKLSNLNIPTLSEDQSTNFNGWEDQNTGILTSKTLLSTSYTDDCDTIYKALYTYSYDKTSSIVGSWKGVVENEDGTKTYLYLTIAPENCEHTELAIFAQRTEEPAPAEIEANKFTITTNYVSQFNLLAKDTSIEEDPHAFVNIILNYKNELDKLSGTVSIYDFAVSGGTVYLVDETNLQFERISA